MLRKVFFIYLLINSIITHAINYNLDNDDSYITITSNEDENLTYSFTLIKKFDLASLGIHSCNESPLTFDRCIPSICLIKSKFGNTIVKIKAISDKGCEYIERSSKIGGVNCSFPIDELSDVDYLFNKRFSKQADLEKENLFSDEEIGKSQEILNKYCKSVKDFSLTKTVHMEDIIKQDDSINDPEFTINEIKRYIKSIPSKVKFNNRFQEAHEEVTLQNLKTLMFATTEINALNKIIEGFDSSVRDLKGNYSSYVKNGPGTFHLDSLFYQSSDKWSIWLNGVKYDNTSQSESVKIESASNKDVTINWIVENINRVSPDWQVKLVKISENKYASKANDIVLEIKSDKAYFYFKLKPNQTFDSREMIIFEGKQR